MSNPPEPVMACPPEVQLAMLESTDPQVAANKRLVWDMWREFIQGGDLDAADRYLAPEYHQHNPNAQSGLDGVKAFFRAAGIERTEPKDHIDGLVAMTGERDLVTLALVYDGTDQNGDAYTSTWFDMFRVTDGKIIEHWDSATKP